MFTLYLIACRSNLTVYAAISIYVLLPSFYLYFYVLVRTIVLVYNHVIFSRTVVISLVFHTFVSKVFHTFVSKVGIFIFISRHRLLLGNLPVGDKYANKE